MSGLSGKFNLTLKYFFFSLAKTKELILMELMENVKTPDCYHNVNTAGTTTLTLILDVNRTSREEVPAAQELFFHSKY